jgi:hypothetical protein
VSNINYLSINENFPVAGQDNDTQVFRDNFDTIKTSLRVAKEEITDLESSTARLDQSNDFNGNVITNVTVQGSYIRKYEFGSPITNPTQEISFLNGHYQIVRFSSNCALSFEEFPTEVLDADNFGKVGKVSLELYGDGTARTITFSTSGSTVFKKSADFPVTLTVTSATNPVIIEVWQHNTDNIFLNYVGEFS